MVLGQRRMTGPWLLAGATLATVPAMPRRMVMMQRYRPFFLVGGRLGRMFAGGQLICGAPGSDVRDGLWRAVLLERRQRTATAALQCGSG